MLDLGYLEKDLFSGKKEISCTVISVGIFCRLPLAAKMWNFLVQASYILLKAGCGGPATCSFSEFYAAFELLASLVDVRIPLRNYCCCYMTVGIFGNRIKREDF